jgi:hypothetical protein
MTGRIRGLARCLISRFFVVNSLFDTVYFFIAYCFLNLIQFETSPSLVFYSRDYSMCGTWLHIFFRQNLAAPLDSIWLVPYGRFGNNVFQMGAAVHYSTFMDVRFIYTRPSFLYLNTTCVTTRGVTIIPRRPSPTDHVIFASFYHPIYAVACPPVNFFFSVATFRHHILGKLGPPPAIPLHATFAHVRSGDIFFPPFASAYGQPPCHYYLEALQLDNATEVRPISEDTANPCLGILLKHTRAPWRRRRFKTDLVELIYSHRLILARGTLGSALLWLSPWRKVFYAMKRCWPGFGRHYDCMPTARYMKLVLSNWTASPVQLHLMTVEKCQTWIFMIR